MNSHVFKDMSSGFGPPSSVQCAYTYSILFNYTEWVKSAVPQNIVRHINSLFCNFAKVFCICLRLGAFWDSSNSQFHAVRDGAKSTKRYPEQRWAKIWTVLERRVLCCLGQRWVKLIAVPNSNESRFVLFRTALNQDSSCFGQRWVECSVIAMILVYNYSDYKKNTLLGHLSTVFTF